MALKSTADFALRLLFFAAAPSLLVYAAAFFPITGALAQAGLALGVFFAGEAVRNLASRSKIASKVLGSQLAFEAYYREHPPRPFLYYVFYPLLFPYWLFVREARREFLLFKGYTLASFALLVVSLVAQFFLNFPPELTLRDFWPIAAGTLAVETIVVLMLLMPIVTTVVHFHRMRAPRRLLALLMIAIVSIGLAVFRLERKRDPIVSIATRARVNMRSQADKKKANVAYRAALVTALRTLPRAQSDLDSDGKVEGIPLEAAREELRTFFKNDESYAFDLWFSQKRGEPGVMIVYVEAWRNRPAIWRAMDTRNKEITDPKKLPKGAFVAMKNAAD
jgi:hypothetical protein